MKKRWYNYRPLLLVFACLMLGALFAFYVTKYSIVSYILIGLIFTLILVVSIIKKKIKYFLVPVISFIVAVGYFHVSIHQFNKRTGKIPEQVNARIYSITSTEQGVIKVKADDVKFNNKKIDANINILVYDGFGLFNNLQIGDKVKFKPEKFYKTDLFYNSTPNSKTFENNLKYTLVAKVENVVKIGNDIKFTERIKNEIKNNLRGGLTNENVELAYSTLFGDKDFLGDIQYKAYRLSGIAHLLAVSGLHVSIIVTLVTVFLSLVKVKGWPAFIITTILLLLYSYLCGFSVSVVRASIMYVLLALSKQLGKEYDPLSSIGFAGIVIFIMNPLCIYDISFLMSFACAFGIVLFSKPISQCLVKCKISKNVADAMAITISTLIALLVISAFYFNNINVISLIANLILIPIFTVAFSIVFAVSLVALIFPFVNIVLLPINYIFDFINVTSTVLGNLNFANISTTQLNFIAIPIYFILLFTISRICIAKHRNKIMFTLPTLAILLVCLI